MFVLLLIFLLFILILYYLYYVNKYKVIDEYPGPSALELIKFMLLPKTTMDSYKFIASLTKKYGPVVKIWIKPFRPTLLVSDGNFVKSILLSKEHVNKTGFFGLLRAFVGDGLPFMSDMSLWRHERKTLAHVFNNQFIINYISTIKIHAVKLGQAIHDNVNKPVDLQVLMLRHGLNIIYDLLLNEDISKEDDRVNSYMTSLRKFLGVYYDRINSPLKMIDSIFKYTDNFKIWTSTSIESKQFIEGRVKQAIESKKNVSSSSDQKKDFIDLLLDSKFSYDRILENIRTFVVAGSDTVSVSSSFALYELAKRPDLQEKIYQEYISICGTDKNVFAEFRDIQQMTFTECVIKESLRLYPPVPFLFRTLLTPSEIGGKMIPADVDITFSLIDSHHANFEDPDEFKPERFLPENASKIPANCYYPFSVGPRDCMGKAVAMVESKVLLTYIIRNFTLHPIENHEMNLCGEIVLTSRTGLPVIFKKRMS